MATDKLYLLASDFGNYKDISENLDEDRLNIYIRDAQVLDLRAFLGKELYLLLQLSFTEPNTYVAPYDKLMNGEDLNGVRFYGLKPLIIEYAYARLLEEISMNVTRTGAKLFVTEEGSEAPTQAQINTKVSAARSIALSYGSDMEVYLTEKKTDFPEWKNSNEKTTGFNFFKV